MGFLTEDNWRVSFWDMWEGWEEADDERVIKLFWSPGAYMNWAERPNDDLGGVAPWQFAQKYGADNLMDYLYYMANKDYWDRACDEYLERMGRLEDSV